MGVNNHQTTCPDAALPFSVQTDLAADGCLTVDESGEFLGIGRNAIYNAIAAGQLPTCKFGRATRVPKRALVLFAAARMTGGWALQSHTPCADGSQPLSVQEVAEACCQSVANNRRA